MSAIKTVISYAEASNIISVQRAIEAENELEELENLLKEKQDTIDEMAKQAMFDQGVILSLRVERDDARKVIATYAYDLDGKGGNALAAQWLASHSVRKETK